MVQVLFRDSRSMRRSLRAPKRASADSGRYSTLAVSPSAAAATALQKSTSNPRQTPELSFSENPGRPSLTPQISLPLARTSSIVPAIALPAATVAPTQSTEVTPNAKAPQAARIGRVRSGVERPWRGETRLNTPQLLMLLLVQN